MRKLLCLLLTFALILPLAACQTEGNPKVTFYYVRQRDDFIYGIADGVITGESRDNAGHMSDLRYVLTLYLKGPVTESLRSPFPAGCSLVSVKSEQNTLDVTLSGPLGSLDGIHKTLAWVCLAKTCFSLTTAQTLRIHHRTEDGAIELLQTISADDLLTENAETTNPNS